MIKNLLKVNFCIQLNCQKTRRLDMLGNEDICFHVLFSFFLSLYNGLVLIICILMILNRKKKKKLFRILLQSFSDTINSDFAKILKGVELNKKMNRYYKKWFAIIISCESCIMLSKMMKKFDNNIICSIM